MTKKSEEKQEVSQKRTPEQLRQIALDMADLKIFTSMHIREGDMSLMKSIFLPLVFMDKEQIERLQAEKVHVIFEYNSERMERCINGYPIFMSFQKMTKEEWDTVLPMVKKLEKDKEEFLKGQE